jgi:hypothetical protein
MVPYLRSTWKPELYHGGVSAPFFEGWYFKLVDDAPERHSYAIILGVFLGR